MFTKSDTLFLAAAFASFLGSVSLWFLYSREYGLFVGIWVPSILSLWSGVRTCLADLQSVSESRGGKDA